MDWMPRERRMKTKSRDVTDRRRSQAGEGWDRRVVTARVPPPISGFEVRVGEVKDESFNEGVEKDMVRKGIKVVTLEAHVGEELEGELRFAEDGIADDEGLVEAGVGSDGGVAGGGGEKAEPVEDDGHEAGTREEAKDSVIGYNDLKRKSTPSAGHTPLRAYGCARKPTWKGRPSARRATVSPPAHRVADEPQ